MDARTHKILNYSSAYTDNLIKENFSSSYMNNTKWVKLIETLINEFEEIYVNYKLIYDEVIDSYLIDILDFEPFFLEPIIYKEIQWIEFPDEYEFWKNKNNLKAAEQLYIQDLDSITKVIEKIEKFCLEKFPNSIRIYAYR